MRFLFRSPCSLSSIAVALAGMLIVPIGIAAASPARFADPVDAAWNATSGYGVIEASRGEITSLFPASPVDSPAAVEPLRVTAALGALRSGDLGGMQEEALSEVVDAANAWNAVSGYGAVEANRAATDIIVLP